MRADKIHLVPITPLELVACHCVEDVVELIDDKNVLVGVNRWPFGAA